MQPVFDPDAPPVLLREETIEVDGRRYLVREFSSHTEESEILADVPEAEAASPPAWQFWRS